MKELNLKEKIQNLISGQQKNGCPEGKFGYRDLTPESDTKNSEEYIRALHWAIKNKEVKNIALSGPYGAGKSSVIKTYLEKYPKTKYLSISLAAFSTPTKSVNGEDDNTSSLADDWTLDDVDENVIEEGILKQLFYRVDVGKIPQSRYRKIKKLSYWKMFFSLLMLTVVASVVYFEINPNVLEDFKNTVINNGAFFHLNQWSSYAVFIVTIFVVLLLITTVLKYVMSNFRVANINLGDKASISKKEEKESIFDKSLDEIVYFFESTTYDTVFIEDLDRFNQPNIFIKLRELNTVINNYDNIKRKVVFIYAIKDDMFKDEERTKFFDFIVPVIPYINATNSGEILRGLLKFEKGADGVYKSKNYDISDRYIWKISPFVQDMRVLTNIYQNDMYELNNSMVSSVINFYHSDLADGLKNAHYTTILNAEINVLNKRIWDNFEDYINHFVLGIDENNSEEISAVEDIIERLANTNIELVIAVLDKEKVNWDNLDECCENNVEKEKRKEIWNYLLENSRISSTWKNFESYYNEFGITTELSVWVNENCSDIVKSEKTDKIDNDCIKNIITNSEITVQTVEQIADNYKCDEEIEFDVSKLPVDKINLLIRKHYIRYTVSKIEKIRSLAKDSFGVYCKEYIDDFVNDLPSIPLNEREIVMLLNDTTIDKKYKRGILEKISASSMTENLAKTIANNQFNVDKAYVEYAWKNLDNAGRHMLLVNHLQVYSIAEISRLLTDLGGEWSKLSDNKSRHKEEISIDVNGHNEKLLSQLQRKGFITSYPEKKDREKSFFEVWVKQQ